jgi:hypothetical protein
LGREAAHLPPCLQGIHPQHYGLDPSKPSVWERTPPAKAIKSLSFREFYITKETPIDPEPLYRTKKKSVENRLLDSEDGLKTLIIS